MKILLLGANGQLGWELQHTCPDHVRLVTCDQPKIDFCNPGSIQDCIRTTRPDVLINAAAFTAVDQAEKEEETAERINHGAVAEMAGLCRKYDIHMVHISTDFVFNGRHYKPYHPDDTPDPISVYGKSKLKGEEAILHILKDQSLIIRTAWLYSSHGNNFVKTMLKFMTEKQTLNIIDEQIGTPTWAHGLAQAVWTALDKALKGVFHWTDAGVASWYDFAMAIQEEAIHAGLLDKAIPISPIPAKFYPTPAQRPFYGVLDKTSFWKALDIKPLHWRVQLRAMLKEIHP